MAFFIWIKEWWKNYQHQKKMDALYARLDRNAAGKFSQKDYLKQVAEQKKVQMKKNREKQQEVKGSGK